MAVVQCWHQDHIRLGKVSIGWKRQTLKKNLVICGRYENNEEAIYGKINHFGSNFITESQISKGKVIKVKNTKKNWYIFTNSK